MAILSTILIGVFCRTFLQKSSPPEARIPATPTDKLQFEISAE
jgi:hypothetical protein